MPEEEYRKIFVERLHYYMNLSGKTQNDLVSDLGYSASTVSDWYNGKKLPRMDKIQALADYFHVEKSDLLEDKHGQKPQYYLNPETAKVAQEIYEDDNLHALFDAARGASPEELQRAKNFLQMLKDTNPDG